MGGKIGVESSLGEGSVFRVTSRLTKGGAESTGAPPVDRPPRGMRVLIVDDSATLLGILHSTLKS